MNLVDAMTSQIHAHQGPILASASSVLGTVSLATGAIPIPSELPGWLPYAVTILGPVVALLIKRFLAAGAAKKRALAGAKERRALALRADKNPANDGDADKLDDDAAVLRAEADALEALKAKPSE